MANFIRQINEETLQNEAVCKLCSQVLQLSEVEEHGWVKEFFLFQVLYSDLWLSKHPDNIVYI